MSSQKSVLRQRWKPRLLIALVAAVSSMVYFARPAPEAAVSAPLREIFFPQFGHGGNPESLNFTTTISLLNLSTTTSQVAILSDSGGAPVPLLRDPVSGNPRDSLTVEIPGNGTRVIQSTNENPDVIQTGSASIFSFNDSIMAQIEFSIFTGNRLDARAQVPGRPLNQAGSIFIGEQGRTGFAVLNPFINNLPAEVLLASVDSGGNVVDTGSIDLMPGEQMSRFLDQLLNTEGAASAEFRSNVPVAILPLQQDGLVLTTQDVFPERNLDSFPNGNGN